MNDHGQLRLVRGLGRFATALLSIGLLFGIVIAVRNGDLPLAALFVGTQVFFAIPVYLSTAKPRFRPRVRVGNQGLEFRPDKRIDLWAAAMMAVGTMTFGAWAALGFAGVVAFPFGTPDGGEKRWPFLISFGSVAVVCGWYLALVLRHRGTSYLRLTPHGYACAEGFTSFSGDWAGVADVTNRTPTYRRPGSRTEVPRPNAWCPITFTRTDGSSVGIPNATLYTADGDALRGLVQFYWRHPERRQELTDDRALHRLHP